MLLDKTIPLMLDPYRYISKNCKKHNCDVFPTRLFLQKTMCISGKDAAQIFYDNNLIMRKGAAPKMLLATLLGKGGVQGLDDDEHKHRKNMFMSVMTDENIKYLGQIVSDRWDKVIKKQWATKQCIEFYSEIQDILTESVCVWAGVTLERDEIKKRSRELTHLFDSAGAKSYRHIQSRLARKKADDWIENQILWIRKKGIKENTPAHIVAWHRDLSGELLSSHTAAVELLNLLRPTVAVSVYMVFVAHALHFHPECRQKLEDREERYDDMFIQEVRRYYPFFPAMFGKVKKDFTWRGQEFKKNVRVIMDIFGTNRDSRVWKDADTFYPERYLHTTTTPFNFIPQGGGDHYNHHRCPGEFIANELMRVTIETLVFKLKYEIPEQDLEINWSRTPPIPKSHMLFNIISAES
jgi:fatty-acid peroxygenase